MEAKRFVISEKWVGIITLVLVAAMTVALLVCNLAYPQDQGRFLPLTERQKADIEEAFNTSFLAGTKQSVQWYEENGGRRGGNVIRYFGTYDDCVVLLLYGNGQSATFQPIEPPFTRRYLSRPVDFPVDVDIALYDPSPYYPDGMFPEEWCFPIITMQGLKELGISWLTDEELEQLTTDLENWLAEGNY